VRKPGGYYLDDGPQTEVPKDLDRIPDAQPKAEPIRPSTTRPYVAMGKTYTPMAELKPYRARGKASWYGRRYHGRPTASGETYDMFAMTAAHPILPIPSYARVTCVDNGRAVVVRVNDRGPFHSDRLIDLSYAAAHRLDLLRQGSGEVEVELIVPDEGTHLSNGMPQGGSDSKPSSQGEVKLQLAVFQSKENALAYLARLKAQADWLAEQLSLLSENGLHRILAGPYISQEEAARVASRIENTLAFRPVISYR
jgi:rare lipoprotein A